MKDSSPPPALLAWAFVIGLASVAQGQVMSDFSLPDVNSGSLRRTVTSAPLSPRHYRHQVTAWYFAHET